MSNPPPHSGAWPPSGADPAQPAPGSGGPGTRRLLLGVAGLLAAIAVVVALLVVLLGGGAHSSARAVAERFVDATNDQDVEAARELLCGELHDEFDAGDQLLLGDTGPLNSVRSALGEVRELDADRAEADVSLVGEAVPSGFGYTLRLTREDGGWYVCGFGINLDLPDIGGR